MAGRIIKFKSYTLLAEAHIARTKLESEGVRAFIKDEFSANLNIFHDNSGVGLMINEDDLEKAVEILAPPEEKPYSDITAKAYESRCPKCMSTDLTRLLRNPLFLVMSVLLLMLPYPFLFGRMRCRSCGHIWWDQN